MDSLHIFRFKKSHSFFENRSFHFHFCFYFLGEYLIFFLVFDTCIISWWQYNIRFEVNNKTTKILCILLYRRCDVLLQTSSKILNYSWKDKDMVLFCRWLIDSGEQTHCAIYEDTCCARFSDMWSVHNTPICPSVMSFFSFHIQHLLLIYY